jgi:hypothetical protein
MEGDNFRSSEVEKYIGNPKRDGPLEGCQLGEFRYSIFLAVAVLSGLVKRSNPEFKSLAYPVKGLGAEQQMNGTQDVNRPKVLQHLLQTYGLEAFGLNCAETLLCESAHWRRGKIFDYLFRGQDLFLLSSAGRPLIKEYGTTTWKALQGEDLVVDPMRDMAPKGA